MKKNSISFAVPQRQSFWAVIFIILKSLRKIVGQIWPILIAFFLGKSGNSTFDRFEILIAGLGAFGMISSIISFFKYYYHISEEELVIEKGIFKKVKLNLPFERIQSINFNQTVIHQLLKVTAVEIETAGSDKKELKIDALDMETAEALRSYLLEKRAEALAQASGESDIVLTEEGISSPQEEVLILELDNKDLFKVGLAQNHLKPIGLVIGLFGSVFAYSYSFGIDPLKIVREIFNNVTSFDFSSSALAFLLLPFVMVSYSIVTTILRHYKLRFWRSGDRFHMVQGLLTKRQFSALDQKIQILAWGQNPFERLLKQYRINFRQAKAGEGNKEKMHFSIPGCDESRIAYVKDEWLGKEAGSFDLYLGVSSHLFKRSAKYQTGFISIFIIVALYFSEWEVAIGLIVLLTLVIYLSWKEYTKKRYAFNGKEIYVGGGLLGFKHSLFPVHKVQNVIIVQNPYQWRRNLATLKIYTAAGNVNIPYIQVSAAEELLDQIMYKVEVSKKKWM